MDNNAQQSDDFGAFLESVQRAVKPGEVGSTGNIKIMNMLAKLGEVDMAQLVAMVELPWSDFTTGIESLKSAGLVIVNETTQGGKVQLTSDGQRWASALSSPNKEG
jgi:predicted transcriptional regulator